jgi:hypothetical protein
VGMAWHGMRCFALFLTLFPIVAIPRGVAIAAAGWLALLYGRPLTPGKQYQRSAGSTEIQR